MDGLEERIRRQKENLVAKGEWTHHHSSSTATTSSNRFIVTKGFQSSNDTKTTGRRMKLQRQWPVDGAGVSTAVERQPPLRSMPTTLPTRRREIQQHPAVDGTLCHSLWCTKARRVRESSTPKNEQRDLTPFHLGHWTKVAPTPTLQMFTLSLGP